MNRKLLIIPGLISGLSIFALSANAAETRCGWLQNPTPGNWWITDRDGRWTISQQGGYQARGMDNMPSIGEREYIRTNGNYGYTCACLRVVTDRKEMRIISIQSGKQLLLKTCQEDPNLPETP